jgi:LysM repeat protein
VCSSYLMGLDGLALVTNSSKDELQALNLELIAGKTPLTDRKYEVKIPAGTRTIALNNLPRLRNVVSTEYKTHVIGHHETLATICKKYDLSKTALLKVNTVKNNRYVAGVQLRIPYSTAHYQLASEKIEAIAQVGSRRVLHKVRSGETLPQIARQYHVQPETVIASNDMKNGKKLQVGQQLIVQIAEEKTPSGSPAPASPAILPSGNKHRPDSSIVLTTQKKNAPVQAQKEMFRWYQIANGDTLWTISQKFKTSPDQLKGWNNLKSNSLRPGDRLKVKDSNPVLAERTRTTL